MEGPTVTKPKMPGKSLKASEKATLSVLFTLHESGTCFRPGHAAGTETGSGRQVTC